MKARQGRHAEGEADTRRALLGRLKTSGKYNVLTARFIGFLSNSLIEQGRVTEAELLTRTRIEINRTLGVAKDAGAAVSALGQLASILNLQGQWTEAAGVYAEIDEAISTWAPARREAITLNSNQIATLYATNNLSAGISAAEQLVERQRTRLGERHLDTALARGLFAIGLARAGRDQDAAREFKLAVPILATASRVTDLDDAIDSAARHQRLVLVIESYVALLARTGASEAVSESFRLSDVIRGRSVQNALAASSARAVAGDPALAELARKVQDLDRQIAAELGAFNHALALPPRVAIQPASRRCRLTSTSSKLRAMWPSATSQIVFQPMRA